jgi:hypothetical protein
MDRHDHQRGEAMRNWACCLVAPLVLGGCAIKTFDSDQTSVATDAKQRVILSGMRLTPKGEHRRVVCAEPSPDAVVALAESGALKADVAGQGGGAISASMAESVASLGRRTATIQLLRDGLYRACEAYLNGAIDDFGYALLLGQFDSLMVSMMALEGLLQMQPASDVLVTSTTNGAAPAMVTAATGGTPPAGGSGSAAGASDPPGGTNSGDPVTTKAGGASPAPGAARPAAKFAESEIRALTDPIKYIVRQHTRGTAATPACMIWFAREADRRFLNPQPPLPDSAEFKITSLCENHLKAAEAALWEQGQTSPSPAVRKTAAVDSRPAASPTVVAHTR